MNGIALRCRDREGRVIDIGEVARLQADSNYTHVNEAVVHMPVGPVRIATVWDGIDMGDPDTPCNIFTTNVMLGPMSIGRRRWETQAAALQGHYQTLKHVIDLLHLPEMEIDVQSQEAAR